MSATGDTAAPSLSAVGDSAAPPPEASAPIAANGEVEAAAPAAPAPPTAASPIPVIAFFHGGEDPLGRTHESMLAYSLDVRSPAPT